MKGMFKRKISKSIALLLAIALVLSMTSVAIEKPIQASAADVSLFPESEVSGSAKSKSINKFLVGDWNFKTPFLPITVKKTMDKEGSYSVRGIIGMTPSNVLDSDSTWSSYKDNMEKCKNMQSMAKRNPSWNL